jgi:CspA family cold shock protein
MISHEEATQQTFIKILQQVQSAEIKLAEANKQISDWTAIKEQHENDLVEAKKKARELSDQLFGEKVQIINSTTIENDMDYLGTVKWWNSDKGYGFIEVSKGDDIFAHFQELIMEGFKNLDEGEKVLLNIGHGSRGRTAKNIRRMSK